MKSQYTNSEQQTKYKSYMNSSQNLRSPSESCLKINSLLKKLSKLSNEAQSANLSPKRNNQATIKTKVTPFKSIHFSKKNSSEIKTSEIRTDSTMTSYQCSLPSEFSKSPINIPMQKRINSKRLHCKKTLEKYPRMYLVKQSKLSLRKTYSEIFEEPLQSYYAGISFPIKKKQNIEYKDCSLEYELKGSTNAVNCIESFNEKLVSGGSDCKLRFWPLPLNILGTYTAKTYQKGSVFTNNVVIGKHKKSIVSIAKCGEFIISGSIDGLLRFWDESGKLKHNEKATCGLKCLKALTNEKLIIAGSNLCFFDVNNSSWFRDPIQSNIINCIAIHSSQTFLSGSNNCNLELWDIRADRSINTFIDHNDIITGVTMSSGFTFFSCSDDGYLKEWDIRNGKVLSNRYNNNESLKSIIVNENCIITAGSCITIWNKDYSEKIKFHNGSVKDLHFSHKKNLIFAAGWDYNISAWSFNSNSA